MLLITFIGIFNFLLCSLMSDPVSTVYLLARFKCFIDFKEVFDFFSFIFRDIFQISKCTLSNVTCSDTEKLVIPALFIHHAEHSNNTATDNAAWECWLIKENESVEGITIE